MRLACERLRARRNPGTAMAANRAIIATTIMISTRVKPPRRLLSLFNMLFAFLLSLVCLTAIHDTDRGLDAFKSSVNANGRGIYPSWPSEAGPGPGAWIVACRAPLDRR